VLLHSRPVRPDHSGLGAWHKPKVRGRRRRACVPPSVVIDVQAKIAALLGIDDAPGPRRCLHDGSRPPDDGHANYWRLHGPITLTEYDNTRNDANHIHSIWHDLRRNWGRDLLREHYAHGHAPG
jgi:hypothetical protein